MANPFSEKNLSLQVLLKILGGFAVRLYQGAPVKAAGGFSRKNLHRA
jgi:hypothetical protein